MPPRKKPSEEDVEAARVTLGKPVFDIPKTMGACADKLYQLRQKRLEIEREAKEIAAHEAALEEHIIHSLPKNDASGVRGKVAQVSIDTKEKPTVKDWDAVFSYVHKNKAYDLFQRRLNEKAVAERWENNKAVPGVEKFNVVKVHCTKLGSK